MPRNAEADLYAAIDKVVSKLAQQLRKRKTKTRLDAQAQDAPRRREPQARLRPPLVFGDVVVQDRGFRE